MTNDDEDWNPKTWSAAIDEILRLTRQRDQDYDVEPDQEHDDDTATQ